MKLVHGGWELETVTRTAPRGRYEIVLDEVIRVKLDGFFLADIHDISQLWKLQGMPELGSFTEET